MTKIIFDVETNGLNLTASVLSFSALVVDTNNKVIREYDRYYHLNENEEQNDIAININGLTEANIKLKRKNVTYPKHFKDDKEIFELFSENHELYIAHNIAFDREFIAYHLGYYIDEEKELCTMEATQYVYDAPFMRNGEPKYPKLSEAVAHYNIDTTELLSKGGYHDSLFDCYCCLEIFKRLD